MILLYSNKILASNRKKNLLKEIYSLQQKTKEYTKKIIEYTKQLDGVNTYENIENLNLKILYYENELQEINLTIISLYNKIDNDTNFQNITTINTVKPNNIANYIYNNYNQDTELEPHSFAPNYPIRLKS